MTTPRRDRDQWMAEAARRELAAWEAHGAAMVADDRLDQAELDRNLEAWRVMAALFAAGPGHGVETDLGFADLEQVARAAYRRRAEAVDANQDPDRHAALVQRGDAVAAIYQRIRANRIGRVDRSVTSIEQSAAA